jgi:hypothetical protein
VCAGGAGRRVPPELNVRFGQAVNVAVADKTGEDYRAPPKVLKPFAGQGNRLGSVDPEIPSPAAAAARASPAPVSVPVPVDESAPSTSVQIRLADGSRCAIHKRTERERERVGQCGGLICEGCNAAWSRAST